MVKTDGSVKAEKHPFAIPYTQCAAWNPAYTMNLEHDPEEADPETNMATATIFYRVVKYLLRKGYFLHAIQIWAG